MCTVNLDESDSVIVAELTGNKPLPEKQGDPVVTTAVQKLDGHH